MKRASGTGRQSDCSFTYKQGLATQPSTSLPDMLQQGLRLSCPYLECAPRLPPPMLAAASWGMPSAPAERLQAEKIRWLQFKFVRERHP